MNSVNIAYFTPGAKDETKDGNTLQVPTFREPEMRLQIVPFYCGLLKPVHRAERAASSDTRRCETAHTLHNVEHLRPRRETTLKEPSPAKTTRAT